MIENILNSVGYGMIGIAAFGMFLVFRSPANFPRSNTEAYLTLGLVVFIFLTIFLSTL